MPARSSVAESTVVIQPVQTDEIIVTIVGTSPLICNRMSEKARHDLLLPSGRKTAVEKASTLKHDPWSEFRASPYTLADPSAPTLIALMSSAFKGAMGTAALDLPGAKKAQIGRLVYVLGELVPIYGPVQLLMSVTRSADINHTPDIRSRVVLPRWACQVHVRYVGSIINRTSIANLLAGAGVTAGVGDWRPEKGKGNYGQFRVAHDDDAEFLDLQAFGRTVQQAGMDEPAPYNDETREMLAWFDAEAERRGRRSAA